jgi:hypothetical protein
MKTTVNERALVKITDMLSYLDQFDMTMSIAKDERQPCINIKTSDNGCYWNFNILNDGRIHIIEFSEDSELNNTYDTWQKFYNFMMPDKKYRNDIENT